MADGIMIIDKPAGWTSMDVCAKLRGALREKRVGHGGTLDPMATGVLPVFVGQATKAVEYAENSQKEYVGGLRLGLVTDTQDITGNVLQTRPVTSADTRDSAETRPVTSAGTRDASETCPVTSADMRDSAETRPVTSAGTRDGAETRPVIVTAADVKAALSRFTGEIEQIPPMYSAVKVGGKKLYELARKGKEIERPPRTVTIYELELLEQVNDTDYRFRCLCSKGTYIRTLCHDIGAALGCGGTLYALRRTRAAGFTEADAVTLEAALESGAAALRPVDTLFSAYPALRAPSPGTERRIRCGNEIRTRAADGVYRVYSQAGEFLCLSEARDGVLKSLKNFFTS